MYGGVVAAVLCFKAVVFGAVKGCLKALGMAWHDNQQGITTVGLPSLQQQRGFVLLLVKAGAGGHHHWAVADALGEIGSQGMHGCGGADVVFAVAAHCYMGSTDTAQALGIGFGLCIAAAQGLQGRANQAAGFQVALL